MVNASGHIVQTVVRKALCHIGFNALQSGCNPTVGLAECHVAMPNATRRQQFIQTAIVTFTIHQCKAGGVPQLVAKIAVAFAALAVKADVAAQRCERGKGETQCICAECGNTVWKFFLGVFTHGRCGFGFAQAGGAFFQQGLQCDAINQVHWVQHIAFGLAHLLALCIAYQTVNVDVFERHFAGEVLGHHDHARHPKENDVVACDQHAGWQVQIHVLCFFRPTHGGEGH